MPQIGKMKFPYTKAGKDRYQAIKKQLTGGVKPGRAPGRGPISSSMKPGNRPSRPPFRGPGDFRPGGMFDRRPKPPNRKYM